MPFVLIPSGSFVMGSAKTQLQDQKPPHPVTISRPFYLAKYEVTQEQWQAVMSNTPSIHRGPHYPDSAKYPVENVSWDYCQLFLNRLKEKTGGREFRLPTEAEWEYACRAGTTNDCYFDDSNTPLADCAWFSENAASQTHPVGMKKPNAWGLYDLYGNVWEWCGDVYAPYPSNAVTDPVGPGWGTLHVLRGGAYNSIPKHISSSYRHDLESGDSYRYYGFRVALSQTGRSNK